jgi:hypothetical protein
LALTDKEMRTLMKMKMKMKMMAPKDIRSHSFASFYPILLIQLEAEIRRLTLSNQTKSNGYLSLLHYSGTNINYKAVKKMEFVITNYCTINVI